MNTPLLVYCAALTCDVLRSTCVLYCALLHTVYMHIRVGANERPLIVLYNMHTRCGGAGVICGGAVTHAVGTVQFTETRTRDSRAKQRTTVYCCPQYGGNSLPPAPFGRMCPPRCSMGNSPPACIRGTSRVNLRPMCHPHHVSQVPSPSPRHKSSAPLPCHATIGARDLQTAPSSGGGLQCLH